MTDAPKRRRAPAMSQEERRAMIIRTALPLVAEHGASVTTGQIARAAGIGEGTIFRAFTDKSELLGACMAEVLRTDTVLDQLADLSLDQPLTDRLLEAAEVLNAHVVRIGRVVAAMQASGFGSCRPAPEEVGRGEGRESAQDAAAHALAELFEPEADALRLPAIELARMFHMMLLANARTTELDRATMAVWIEVFLHGALTSTTQEPR
jgi:AcrR family transcriptional regulator